MSVHRLSWWPGLLLIALSAVPVACVQAVPALATPVASEQPLAFIGDDTLRVVDLDIELSLMRQRAPSGMPIALPEPAAVLKRMIENQLIIQEGYRMGLDQQFTVKNQVTEAVRTQCSKALLDSVAATAAADVPSRTAAVHAYIQGLREQYAVTVDTTLLKSLDYGSADPAIQQHLHDSEDVLTRIPSGTMRVKHLSREIRFREYHGMEGKPDAAERRDKIFASWLDEALVRYQAKIEHVDERPDLRLYARRLERQLVQEESVKIFAAVDTKPTDAEVEAFYEKHLSDVTPAPRVKLDSVKLESKEAAETMRTRLAQGAMLGWLRRNLPGVVDGPPPFPQDFFDPQMLGIEAVQMKPGTVLDPFEVPGGWVVAVVDGVEKVEPAPLDACRSKIIGLMRTEQSVAQMSEAITKLRAATPITIVPDAEAMVAARVAAAGTGREGAVAP